jgi:dihydrolipoamide dehydrogenase
VGDIKTSAFLAVIGGGPGGYPAAFHAADLGMQVVLIDREPNPGGVCLYRGCIPSKSILHAASAIQMAKDAPDIGITLGEPTIDLAKLRRWKQGVVEGLTSGLGQLTKQRGITYIQGEAQFSDGSTISVRSSDGMNHVISFEHAIVATGSEPTALPFLPDSERIMSSKNALDLKDIPEKLLVIGGGYIGLELGQAYNALGSNVAVVEALPYLLPGIDRDLAVPLTKRLEKRFSAIMTKTKVTGAAESPRGIVVSFDGPDGQLEETFDAVLVAVGRRPSTRNIGLQDAAIDIDEQGFIKVDGQRFTSNRAVQAIGDAAGQPMLAHKATHEGRMAVEALNDGKTVYDPIAIPAVMFTDPEIAWCGLTEDEARRTGRSVRIGKFPWQASGRAATIGRQDGLTKVIADEESGIVVGVGICGDRAGDMIGEGVLAIEMGCVLEDIALTIHPHPTLSETIMEAAERAMGGSSTHFFQRQG